ncbi:MAG TPA: nuclear transport factor 2 family protein [Ktedonobacteraceae bacterium]|jgi:hypothetical protein
MENTENKEAIPHERVSGDLPIAQVIANRWIEAFNTRNLVEITALYAPDAELYDSGMHQPRHGLMQIESWFRLRFAGMPANVYSPETYHLVDSEHISVEWTLYGRSPALLGQAWLAHPFQVRGTSSFVLRDTLICKQQGSYDHLFVLRQVLPWLRFAPAPLLHIIYALYLLRHRQW